MKGHKNEQLKIIFTPEQDLLEKQNICQFKHLPSFDKDGIIIQKQNNNNEALNIQQILQRKKILQQAILNLKNKFVGIDQVIDKISQQIYTWYCMPQLLLKPVVLCL